MKQDIYDYNYSGGGASSPRASESCHGPDNQLLLQGLHQAHLKSKSAYRRLVGPCFILSISFIVAATIIGTKTPGMFGNILAIALWLLSFFAALVTMMAIHRGHLHHLCELATHRADDICPEEGFQSVRHHRLLARLGLSSTRFNGDLITTSFYLGRDERDQSLAVVTFSKSLDYRTCFDQSMSLPDFLQLVFARRKSRWLFANDKLEAAFRGFSPKINSFVKNSTVDYLPVEAFASINNLLKSGLLLSALLKRRPDDLDLLPEIQENQLRLWCRMNLPRNGWRQRLSINRTSVVRLIQAIEDHELVAKPIPSVLLERAVDYCLLHKGANHLPAFSSWLRLVSPSSMPIPKYPHSQNDWMLRAVSNERQFRSKFKIYSNVPGYFEAYKNTIRKIIEANGLHNDSSMDEACYIGYRNLYGIEETLKKYPESRRALLSSDLDI